MKDNLLKQSLTILSEDASEQEKYIRNLFGDKKYTNAEELLLEFEDASFMIENYSDNEEINILFTELKDLIEEIDIKKLFYTHHLKHDLWEKIRLTSRELLASLNIDSSQKI